MHGPTTLEVVVKFVMQKKTLQVHTESLMVKLAKSVLGKDASFIAQFGTQKKIEMNPLLTSLPQPADSLS